MLQQVDERICSRFGDLPDGGPLATTPGRKSAPSSPSRSSTKPPPTATDIGKRVLFHTQTDKKEKSGKLRYYGSPEFAPGVWCGIELDEPLGKNNGSVSGIRYFSCPSNHGLFVPLGRVTLDPTQSTKPRKISNRFTKPPFFYNTLPRSSSIPTGLHNLGLSPRSSTISSPQSPDHTVTRRISPGVENAKVWPLSSVSSTQLTPTVKKSFGRLNKEDSPRIKSESSSCLINSKKKFSSELNIQRKSKSTVDPPPLIAVVTPQPKRFRKTLASCSNEFSSTRTAASSIEAQPISSGRPLGLRTFNSCSNLLQTVGTFPRGNSPRSIVHNRDTSPGGTSPEGGLSPKENSLKGTFPRGISPMSTPYDSEADSFCSSTSDLSRRSTSDSDPTPRSSSVSPDLDSAFILAPPTSGPSVTILTSPEPVVKGPGLSTVATNLIESSRSNGVVGEYRGPSPEGPSQQRKFQNHQGGRTLEHPLVNGQSAHKKSKEEDNGIFNHENGIGNHGDLGRLDDMSIQLDACLNQYALMNGRVGDMELALISFKKDVLSILGEIKDSFQRQVDIMKQTHQQQIEELTRTHQQEMKELVTAVQSVGHNHSAHNLI